MLKLVNDNKNLRVYNTAKNEFVKLQIRHKNNFMIKYPDRIANNIDKDLFVEDNEKVKIIEIEGKQKAIVVYKSNVDYQNIKDICKNSKEIYVFNTQGMLIANALLKGRYSKEDIENKKSYVMVEEVNFDFTQENFLKETILKEISFEYRFGSNAKVDKDTISLVLDYDGKMLKVSSKKELECEEL